MFRVFTSCMHVYNLWTAFENQKDRKMRRCHASSVLWRSTLWLFRRIYSEVSICQFLSAKRCPYQLWFQEFPWRWETENMRSFFISALNRPKILLLGGRKQESADSLTVNLLASSRINSQVSPCDCHSLVGPWVAEKKSCPRGYVCILEQGWNSVSNVLSAVMLSFIYTLSSFDFWDFAAVSQLSTYVLYWAELCKWISAKKIYPFYYSICVEYTQHELPFPLG